jgi:hypothetical protein
MFNHIAGNIILILSLVILATALYYLIRKASARLTDNESREREYFSGHDLYSQRIYNNSLDKSDKKAEALPVPEHDQEVKNAAGKIGRHENSGMYFFFSKQPESHKKRSKVRARKQPSVHGIVH